MYVTDRRDKKRTCCALDPRGESAVRQRILAAQWSQLSAPLDSDDRVSAALLPSLWALYGNSDEEVCSHLERFRDANREHLCFVAEQHADDQRVAPLLHQPELLLILDRLESDPRGLLEAWPLTVPRVWLEALADAWGSPL